MRSNPSPLNNLIRFPGPGDFDPPDDTANAAWETYRANTSYSSLISSEIVDEVLCELETGCPYEALAKLNVAVGAAQARFGETLT